MTIKRHLYVPDCVDVNAQRKSALNAGEPAVLHLHPYSDTAGDSCILKEPEMHETYGVPA